jgi:hypothetical protein
MSKRRRQFRDECDHVERRRRLRHVRKSSARSTFEWALFEALLDAMPREIRDELKTGREPRGGRV